MCFLKPANSNHEVCHHMRVCVCHLQAEISFEDSEPVRIACRDNTTYVTHRQVKKGVCTHADLPAIRLVINSDALLLV